MTAHVADVAIVGGGIAGLTAAYELHRRGVRFELFEAAPRAGGLILTERHDGFVIDAGPDSLLVDKPAAVELCHELGLGDRLMATTPPRTAFVLHRGRLHALPEHAVFGIPTSLAGIAGASLFSPLGRARLALELAIPARTGAGDESIAAFMRRRFGAESVPRLADPLLAGIHAGDAAQLSVRALFPRLTDAEQAHGSVLRAFRRRAPRQGGAFRSLPDGLGELVAALTRTLPARSLHYGAVVSRVEAAGRAEGARFVVTAGAETVPARAVIAATPAHTTAALIRGLDPHLADLCDGIPYVSSATVVLGYPREAVRRPLAGSGFVVSRADGPAEAGRHTRGVLLAATWVSAKWAHRAPPACVLMRGFVGGTHDPQAVDRDDDDLAQAVHRELAGVMRIDRAPVLARVYRWPRGNPQYLVGHRDRVQRIEERLARQPGLFLTGSGFRGTGIPDCVADARRVARDAVDLLQIVQAEDQTL